MKVKELRDLLKGKDIKLINDAFVEVYKALPKSKKEELDSVIESIVKGEGKKKTVKQEEVSLNDLFVEIQDFLQDAYHGFYIAPNRIVPKKERPKWRYKVKRYLKILFEVSSDHPDFLQVVILIREIYKVLSYGCGVYVFSSDDPFASVGIAQEELYEEYIKRQMQLPVTEETIREMVTGATHCYLSRECLHEMLYGVLNFHIQKLEYRDMVKAYGQKFIESQKKFIASLERYDDRLYEATSLLNETNDVVFIFHYGSFEKALQYYFKNSYERNQEVTLYKVLMLTEIFFSKKEWIEAYEYGLKLNIEPRQSLQDKYKKYKA